MNDMGRSFARSTLSESKLISVAIALRECVDLPDCIEDHTERKSTDIP